MRWEARKNAGRFSQQDKHLLGEVTAWTEADGGPSCKHECSHPTENRDLQRLSINTDAVNLFPFLASSPPVRFFHPTLTGVAGHKRNTARCH